MRTAVIGSGFWLAQVFAKASPWASFRSPMVLDVTRRYTIGFLERIVARVPVTALLQGGYTVRDNVRECSDEA